ncbi:MAG TPA: hypothetical protein VKA27_18265 [Sunxiuqinia sp.]|nr:hypothetical protein [Sunxiuqinia sp.]
MKILYVVDAKSKIRVIKKKLPLPELYANETELKKAAADLLEKIPRCELFKTDNAALRIRGGIKAKSREPGMSDQHLCINGFFVALEAKMPGKDLEKKLKQPEYRDKVRRGGGIHITYHSIFELTEELKKYRLLPKTFELT